MENTTLCIFLDDERLPTDVTWIDYSCDYIYCVTRTSALFKAAYRTAMQMGGVDAISLDHDIQDFNNGKETTGYDLIKWVTEYHLDHPEYSLPTVYVHSKNPIGNKNILEYWNNFLMNIKKGS